MNNKVKEKKHIDINALALLMANNFTDDPLYRHLFYNDHNKIRTMAKFFYSYISWIELFSEIRILDNEKAAIIVYDSTKQYHKRMLVYNNIIFALRTMSNIKLYSSLAKLHNIIELRHMLNSTWISNYINSNYLHIDLVVVDKEHRNKGYCSRLFRPILDRADNENLVTTIETHNCDNISIYQRYGFVIVEVIKSKYPDLKQICMVRSPVSQVT